ncbi:MAG: HAD family phosphatase [Clostridiales bacterium]|nr:HAD family phosphatase [Candidatus Cacconaster stercorequi]
MLIFDMDGTLIDSNGIWREVDEAFLAKRGYPYTQEYYEGVAHTIFPLAAVFTKEYCHLEESTDEIMAEWMEMAGDAYATKIAIKPGVREYLARCKDKGERMIVLTSSVPAHCYAALEHLELIDYFEKVIFAQDLKMEKKNPEVFHAAACTMGVSESECTVFDDSVAACRGAKEAGMTVIGVYDPFFAQTEEEMRRICDDYIMSFEELTEA